MKGFLYFCKKTDFAKTATAILIILYLSLMVVTPLVEKVTRIYGPQIAAKQLETGTSDTEYAVISMLLGGEVQNIIFQTTILLVLGALLPFGVKVLYYLKEDN